MKKPFAKSINVALKNQNLAGILDRWNYPTARAKAYEGIDFDALRTLIAERKSYAADHLDELAEQFKKAAEARGPR
jgi:L-lactate utilization protein LutB